MQQNNDTTTSSVLDTKALETAAKALGACLQAQLRVPSRERAEAWMRAVAIETITAYLRAAPVEHLDAAIASDRKRVAAEAEAARLRERVAALTGALEKAGPIIRDLHSLWDGFHEAAALIAVKAQSHRTGPALKAIDAALAAPAAAGAGEREAVIEAARALRAFERTEPEKDCWDTDSGEEEPDAVKFASDWSWNAWQDERLARVKRLDEALARLSPPAPAEGGENGA